MPGVNESGVRESAVDPKEAISTESINVLTSAGQQVEIEASNQKTGNGSDDGEIIVDHRKSVASESFNVVTSGRQQLEIEASYQSSGGTKVVVERVVLIKEKQSRLRRALML